MHDALAHCAAKIQAQRGQQRQGTKRQATRYVSSARVIASYSYSSINAWRHSGIHAYIHVDLLGRSTRARVHPKPLQAEAEAELERNKGMHAATDMHGVVTCILHTQCFGSLL